MSGYYGWEFEGDKRKLERLKGSASFKDSLCFVIFKNKFILSFYRCDGITDEGLRKISENLASFSALYTIKFEFES